MAVRWLQEALADLRGVRDYIAQDNPPAARRVIGEIRRQVEILSRHPELGRPGRLQNTRELVISRYPYIVAYRQVGADVQILLVIHTSKQWPSDLERHSAPRK